MTQKPPRPREDLPPDPAAPAPVARSNAELVHSLHVHQIELEMQNESLRQTLDELELSKERLVDFYECSPVGYVTLTEQGLIAETNLTGAALLGIRRSSLQHSRFESFVARHEVERWQQHFATVLLHDIRLDCELVLRRGDGQSAHVRLECLCVRKNAAPPTVRMVLTDITRLKEIEHELREAQHLSRIGSCYLDALSGELSAGEELCRVFRRSAIPPYAEQRATLYPEEARRRLDAAVRQALSTGASFDLELQARGGDGLPLWVHTRGAAVRDSRYMIVGVRITVQDISERKDRDAQLRMQALVLDQIQDHVIVTDLNGVVTYVNQCRRRAHIQPLEALVGRHIAEFGTSAEEREAQQRIVAMTLQNSEWRGEVSYSLAGGSSVLLDLRTTLVRNEQGEAVAMVGVGTDISAQRKIEEALTKHQRYQRALFDNFPFMVWLKDTDSRFLAVNEAFAKTFGWPSTESLVGKNDLDITAPELAERYRADDQMVMESGLSKQIQELIESDGERRWFETYKSPVTVHGEVLGVVGFARDISERKATEADLLIAKSAAEKANNAKSRFLAAASHDLRQPLAALALFVGMLRQQVPAEAMGLVGNIQNCVGSLSELLTDLLDVSKLDAGVVTPRHADFAISELLGTVSSIHSAEAGLKGLRLRVRPSTAMTCTDPQLLARMLGNLLANAVRYTERGGVLLACRRHQGRQWIEVWDTGMGIPADKCSVIFEEFSQLDDSRSRGSGLGLAIVAKTAALLGLEIRMQSRQGRGSMFAIELPPGCASGVTAAPCVEAPERRLCIAVVDDNPMVLQALEFSLQACGHEVFPAASGAALMLRLATRTPDLLISDYRLADGETAFDVIAAARAAFGEQLPVGIITGDTDPALIRKMGARGFKVLFKPVQLEALQAFIRDATARPPA